MFEDCIEEVAILFLDFLGVLISDFILESILERGFLRDVIICDFWYGGYIWVCFWNDLGGSKRGERCRG